MCFCLGASIYALFSMSAKLKLMCSSFVNSYGCRLCNIVANETVGLWDKWCSSDRSKLMVALICSTFSLSIPEHRLAFGNGTIYITFIGERDDLVTTWTLCKRIQIRRAKWECLTSHQGRQNDPKHNLVSARILHTFFLRTGMLYHAIATRTGPFLWKIWSTHCLF